MAKDVSLVISAKDNFTSAITKMRTANQSFNKDLDGLNKKLDALNRNKIQLKMDFNTAKKALKDAQKAFEDTGDAASKMEYELANANYDNVKRNLDLVSKNAKQAERDILDMTDAISKADNKAGTGSKSSSALSGEQNILSSIVQAGAIQLIGDTVADAAQTFVGSAYGDEASIMFGNTVGGVATGAAMGSMIMPGIGTLIGAIVGGITGAISGANQVYENEDEAFKGVVQGYYDDVKESQQESLTSGSQIAGNREKMQISFATLLGSDDSAKDFLADITDFAAETPFEYDQLTQLAKTSLAYGYGQDEILPLLTKIGDAGSALGLSPDDLNYVVTYLGRMKTTNKTTLEYLNPLLERGIPVFDYLAEAGGRTKEEVMEMVSKGLVPGEEAAKAIADYMGASFEGNMEKQSQTYEGLQSTWQDTQDQLNAAMGEGYNEERKKGLQAQIDFYSNDVGLEMEDAYRMMGEWQASLDNAREESIRNSISNMMNDPNDELYAEYQNAIQTGDRVEIGRMLAEAQVRGENEYKASNGYQEQLNADLTLIANIRGNTMLNENYYNTGYKLGQEFSKGRAAGAAGTAWAEPEPTPSASREGHKVTTMPRSHATGLFRVPYDGYLAELHEGEAVLTGSESRERDRVSSSPNITIGGTYYIREEADVAKVAQALCREIQVASALSY